MANHHKMVCDKGDQFAPPDGADGHRPSQASDRPHPFVTRLAGTRRQ